MSQNDLPRVSFGDNGATVLGLRLDRYRSNGALAVMADLQWGDGEVEPRNPVSMNLDHDDNDYASRKLQDGEFYAKSYSEGERLFNALIACGWIEVCGEPARSGFVRLARCRLTPKAVILSDASKPLVPSN